jgi:hypothetical protein
VGNQQAPKEFGGELEHGKFSAGIGVWEGGSMKNKDDGSLGTLGPGKHSITLYCGNTGTLTPGGHVRLYAQSPDGALAKGPVVTLP